MLAILQKLLEPLRTRISNLVARAVISAVVDTKKMQVLQLQVLEGETREGCERVQQYGFTSVPFAGCEAVVLFLNGNRDHGLVVATDDRRYRLKSLQPGEVALYTDEGAAVHLKRGRIVVTDEEIRLGSDSASDSVSLASLVLDRLNQIKTAFDGHSHGAGSYNAPAGGGPVLGSSGGATPMGSIASVAATKVKAE